MAEDPAIRALFGVPPTDIDLTASDVSINNRAVIAMLCLAGGAVILRFTARIVLRNALMADDWAIIAALVCFPPPARSSIQAENLPFVQSAVLALPLD
jgi:hypothetical protein